MDIEKFTENKKEINNYEQIIKEINQLIHENVHNFYQAYEQQNSLNKVAATLSAIKLSLSQKNLDELYRVSKMFNERLIREKDYIINALEYESKNAETI